MHEMHLKGMIGYGKVMTRNMHINIMGYTYSDWATNTLVRQSNTDSQSTTGHYICVGGNLVSEKAKKNSI